MRILDRLVGGTFLRLFFVSILATPPLFILGDLTDRLDDYLEQGLTTTELARGYVFNIPEYLNWSLPIAGLIAAVFTVHGMTAHREVVAAKAGGVSFHRLVLPILLLGTLISGIGLAASDLVPLSKRRALAILEGRRLERDWRANFVYQTEQGYFLQGQRLDVSQATVVGVGLHIPAEDDGEGPSIHADAERAEFNPETGEWTLFAGNIRRTWPDGTHTSIQFQRMRVPAIEEVPEDLMEDPRDEDEMTYGELERRVRIVERAGGNTNELRVKLEQKLAIPVATMVIVLFGTPLATSVKRGGAAYGIGISLGSTIVYILLTKVAAGFAAGGAVPPMWAAWAPNVLFGVAGLALLVRVRT